MFSVAVIKNNAAVARLHVMLLKIEELLAYSSKYTYLKGSK